MLKKVKKLVLLIGVFCSSCTSNILPNDFNPKEERSFYVGLYYVNIYKINKSISLENITEYPKYKGLFDNDFQTYKWDSLNFKSELYGTLMNDLNSSIGVTKSEEDSLWAKNLIEKLKTKKTDIAILASINRFRIRIKFTIILSYIKKKKY